MGKVIRHDPEGFARLRKEAGIKPERVVPNVPGVSVGAEFFKGDGIEHDPEICQDPGCRECRAIYKARQR